jgi:hypothetical protein
MARDAFKKAVTSNYNSNLVKKVIVFSKVILPKGLMVNYQWLKSEIYFLYNSF